MVIMQEEVNRVLTQANKAGAVISIRHMTRFGEAILDTLKNLAAAYWRYPRISSGT
ncbi:hypothetical protein [Peribacillus muralis]|uniref:hypothetical protein n=1 Tax=Peribacillus muralis TaxID=264697 RepID=UPI003D05316A